VVAEAEAELICDFAEVYHIYDYQALPLQYAATLVTGLGENSRVKLKLSGTKYTKETFLLAAIADRLSLLVWFQSKDGHANRNRPKSIVNALTEKEPTNEGKPMAFATKKELDAELAAFERRE
jgi:hypothetical protein